jgi:hypothetical protein
MDEEIGIIVQQFPYPCYIVDRSEVVVYLNCLCCCDREKYLQESLSNQILAMLSITHTII